jgi:hypothetical protein
MAAIAMILFFCFPRQGGSMAVMEANFARRASFAQRRIHVKKIRKFLLRVG